MIGIELTGKTYRLALLFCFGLVSFPALSAQPIKVTAIPVEVRPFVEPDTTPIALEAGDLNGDGLSDYVLVLQYPEDNETRDRSLLVLVRQPDKTLKLAKRNDKGLVYCADCGGAMGDPFMGVSIDEPRGFEVEHYGGSAWRWTVNFRFAYSRRDRTWQLVRVEESSFHAPDANEERTTIKKPPKHFGKIDLSEFDPDNYLGVGPK